MIEVLCLDTGKRLYFTAGTPMQAMNQLIYYLNLSEQDEFARVQLLGEGRTLAVVHGGQTWSCLNTSTMKSNEANLDTESSA